MNEHPILFSTPMVQAILDGRKTMTRRICKHQTWSYSELHDVNVNAITRKTDKTVSCPYGEIGDVLWVREGYSIAGFDNTQLCFCYKADEGTMWSEMGDNFPERIRFFKSKPSIHMPKAAARIWLRVEEITVERLQDISKFDAIAEGIKHRLNPEDPTKAEFYHYTKDKWGPSPKHSFQTLFQKINGEDSWDANPWVWVVKFKVLSTAGKPNSIHQ